MHIPIYFNAAPSRAKESGITRIPEGEWVVAGDCIDTRISAIIGDDPLTILQNERKMLPLNINGPKFIVCFMDIRGTEPYINVVAQKVNNVPNS